MIIINPEVNVMFRMFVYRKITKFEYTHEISVLVMTESVFGHNQKHVCGYYFQ